MLPVLIALIDDGIDWQSHPELVVEYDLTVDTDGAVHPRLQTEPIQTDHGTTCAQIIHSYAPESTFCSLCILGHKEKLRGNLTQLLAALAWCRENRVPLVHMSVGSTKLSDFLPIRNAVFELLRQGQVIVAAWSNQASRYTAPAGFSGVLGVAADSSLRGNKYYTVNDPQPDTPWIYASAHHILPNGRETTDANSYAAPTVTARVHELLAHASCGFVSFPTLFQALSESSYPPPPSPRPDFLAEAIVYDPLRFLSREKHLLFRVLEYYSDVQAFFQALNQDLHTPALLIPPLFPHDAKFWSKLFQLCSQRVGIACAGVAPPGLYQSAPCPFWDERARQTLTARLSDVQPIQPSFVLIEPYGAEALRVLCRLKAFLLEQEFACLGVSDHPGAYLYGLEYVSPRDSAKMIVTHLSNSMRPDVILSTFSCPPTGITPALTIWLSDNAITSCDETSNLVILPRIPTQADLDRLVSWIT